MYMRKEYVIGTVTNIKFYSESIAIGEFTGYSKMLDYVLMEITSSQQAINSSNSLQLRGICCVSPVRKSLKQRELPGMVKELWMESKVFSITEGTLNFFCGIL